MEVTISLSDRNEMTIWSADGKRLGGIWQTNNKRAAETIGTFKAGMFWQAYGPSGPIAESRSKGEVQLLTRQHFASQHICPCGNLFSNDYPCPVCERQSRPREYGVTDDTITGGIADLLEYGDLYV